MDNLANKVILASASPARLELLSRIIGAIPQVIVSNVNEDISLRELPRLYVERIAQAKLSKVLEQVDSGYVVAADTTVVLGRSILPKATNQDLVRFCLEKISGRRHRVYTGMCVALKSTDTKVVSKTAVVMSVVKFKRLTDNEIDWYVKSGEGIGKAGGYAVQGLAQCFIPFLRGSVSNIAGLPLFELKNMLFSLGYKM